MKLRTPELGDQVPFIVSGFLGLSSKDSALKQSHGGRMKGVSLEVALFLEGQCSKKRVVEGHW